MKKLLTITALSFLIATPLYASTTPYRAYYPKTKAYYPCDEVKWTSSGPYCYQLIGTTYKSHGIGTLQLWTGVYDTTGKKEFQGDRVKTPNLPTGTIMFGTNPYNYIEFWLKGDDGKSYQFMDLSKLPKSHWSTVL